MNLLAEARARRALSEAGLDPTVALTPASSVTNEVWLTSDAVVRVNRRPNQRLRREAAIAPLLPAVVGYPQILGYGGRPGADWLIVRRVRGDVLSRCWPTMTPTQRRSAIRQLAERLRAVHGTPTPPGLAELASPQLLSARRMPPTDPVLDVATAVRQLPHVDPFLMSEVVTTVESMVPVVASFRATRLIHGDLTFENIMWDGERITAILDFEWCRGAPRDLDLDVLLRCCAFPQLHVAADYEHLTHARDYADVPRWLAEDYPEMFDFPKIIDRLVLYSIAYDLNELMAFPPQAPEGDLDPRHPLPRLRRTIEGGGHVRGFAGQLGPAPRHVPTTC